MEYTQRNITARLVSVMTLDDYNDDEEKVKQYGHAVRALFRDATANTSLVGGLAWLSERTNTNLYGLLINFGQQTISCDDMVKQVNEHLNGIDVPLSVCEITLDEPKLLENGNILRRHTFVCFNPEKADLRVKAIADMEKRCANLPNAE